MVDTIAQLLSLSFEDSFSSNLETVSPACVSLDSIRPNWSWNECPLTAHTTHSPSDEVERLRHYRRLHNRGEPFPGTTVDLYAGLVVRTCRTRLDVTPTASAIWTTVASPLARIVVSIASDADSQRDSFFFSSWGISTSPKSSHRSRYAQERRQFGQVTCNGLEEQFTRNNPQPDMFSSFLMWILMASSPVVERFQSPRLRASVETTSYRQEKQPWNTPRASRLETSQLYM